MGRPAKWSTPTVALRVPERFADALLAIAKQMDEGTYQDGSRSCVQNDFEGDDRSPAFVAPKIQGSLTHFFPVAPCLKMPQKYAEFVESFVQNLADLEGLAQSFEPPFRAGDSVVIRYRYPDDYWVVKVLSVEPVCRGCCSFLCVSPVTADPMRWYWFAGSDVTPIGKEESLDSAIRRLIIQESCHRLLRTEFRDRVLGLNLNLWGRFEEVSAELLDCEDEELISA